MRKKGENGSKRIFQRKKRVKKGGVRGEKRGRRKREERWEGGRGVYRESIKGVL